LRRAGVGERVDLDDFAAADGEAYHHHRQRLLLGAPRHDAGHAVHERRLGQPGDSREPDRLPGDGHRAANLDQRPRTGGTTTEPRRCPDVDALHLHDLRESRAPRGCIHEKPSDQGREPVGHAGKENWSRGGRTLVD